MLKEYLALILAGSLLAGSSFAAPLPIQKMLKKNNFIKSSLTTQNNNENNKSRFSGTWEGNCNFNNENSEEKIRIFEDGIGFSITHLSDKNFNETYFFNDIKTENSTNSEFYDSFTTRIFRADDSTIRLSGSGTGGQQLGAMNNDKDLYSFMYTATFKLENNNLTYTGDAKVFQQNDKKYDQGFKCSFKRVG